MKVVNQSAEIISVTPDALKLIEKCGRVCYKSEDKITDDSCHKFVKMIIKRGHESVLEHAGATVHIITDRGITHEIVRHRIGTSYSQESTRYVDYNNNEIQVIEPTIFKTNKDGYEDWLYSCEDSLLRYSYMRKIGVSPQWARSVLPNSLKTEIMVTANFRAWRHFFIERLFNIGAHPQIRELYQMIYDKFLDQGLGILFEDLENEFYS